MSSGSFAVAADVFVAVARAVAVAVVVSFAVTVAIANTLQNGGKGDPESHKALMTLMRPL